MKVLFNATTNISGGGAKNSAIFLRHALESSQHDWRFVISPQVASIIDGWGLWSKDIVVLADSPTRSSHARQELLQIQVQGGFDIAYTMAGPAYVRFTCPHVMGISNPYVSHVDLRTFVSTRSARSWVPDALKVAYQSFHARRANRLVFQTSESRDKFCRRLHYPRWKTNIVPNAFDPGTFAHVPTRHSTDYIRVLVPAASHPHKLLNRIPAIAEACQRLSRQAKIQFVLTIDPKSADWRAIAARSEQLGTEKSVETIGPYNYADAAQVYADCDIVLSLSILETFSATPLEAFSAGRPHISADRSYAREICGDAAVYVDPYDCEAVARAIGVLVNDTEQRGRMVAAGREILQRYVTQSSRFNQILALLEYEGTSHRR